MRQIIPFIAKEVDHELCIQMDKVFYDVNGRLVDDKEYEYLMEIDKRDKGVVA